MVKSGSPFLLLLVFLISVLSTSAETGVDLPGEASAATRKVNPAYAIVVDDPALPRVLLIGDSISIGYTAPVREVLAGKVNLHRIPENGGDTRRGLDNLTKWLAPENGSWDLIHFNWGLWDLCYRNPEAETQGNRDKVHGTLTHTPAEYAANLEQLARQLQQTGAKLIFATTTPVPEGELGRIVGALCDIQRQSRTLHRTGVRLEFAGDDLQQRGFTRAIWTHDARTSEGKLHRQVGEQRRGHPLMRELDRLKV